MKAGHAPADYELIDPNKRCLPLWLAVDRTEILYLYYGDEERAKRIQQMLQETGVLKTTIRKVDIPGRNYEIQIKVGQIPTTGPI